MSQNLHIPLYFLLCRSTYGFYICTGSITVFLSLPMKSFIWRNHQQSFSHSITQNMIIHSFVVNYPLYVLFRWPSEQGPVFTSCRSATIQLSHKAKDARGSHNPTQPTTNRHWCEFSPTLLSSRIQQSTQYHCLCPLAFLWIRVVLWKIIFPKQLLPTTLWMR